MRARALLLVICLMVPAVVYDLWGNARDHRIQTRRVEQDLASFSSMISVEEARIVETAPQLLETVARIEQLTRNNRVERYRVLMGLASHLVDFANYGIIAPDGKLEFSSVPVGERTDLSDAEFVRRVTTDRRPWMSVSVGPDGAARSGIVYALPVQNADGSVEAIVFAIQSLSTFNELSAKALAALPPTATVTVIRDDGVVVAHQPEEAGWVGRHVRLPALFEQVRSRDGGLIHATDRDGHARVYAVTPIQSALFGERLYVSVSVTESALYAKANEMFGSRVAFFFAFATFAALLFWVLLELTVLRRMRVLVAATLRVRQGDLTAHTGLSKVRGELGELARSFDQMVESLGRTQHALRESETLYRSLFESAPLAISLTTVRGEFVAANGAFLAMSGYTEDEIARLDANDLYPEHTDRERLIEMIRREGVIRATEDKLKRKDGTVLDVEKNVTPVSVNGREVFLAILTDISERKRIEHDLERNEKQLRHSQKMEAIGQLAGGVAHDFNNLLTAVQGYAELSLVTLEPDSPVVEYIHEIMSTAARGGKLTHQLLLFSRKTALEMRDISLNSVIENMLAMLRRLIGENVVIRTELEETPCMILADAGNIEQVLMNLVINARDAMPMGGTITISTSLVRGEDEAPQDGNGHIRLTVADTGVGMSAETMSHLFEPFFTTKEREGYGLGLSVVYGIVREHNASISVESQEGLGTTFEVVFPCVAPADRPEESVSRREGAPAVGRNARLLVVEDELELRTLLDVGLSDRGYTVRTAPSAEDAVALFMDERFDLVVSDVMLPTMDGIELCEHLRSVRPDLPCVLMSGYLENGARVDGFRGDAFAFIEKPFALFDLTETIAGLLGRS